MLRVRHAGLVWLRDGHGRARDDHSFHTNYMPGSPAVPVVPSSPILSVVDDSDPLLGELADVPAAPDGLLEWGSQSDNWRDATSRRFSSLLDADKPVSWHEMYDHRECRANVLRPGDLGHPHTGTYVTYAARFTKPTVSHEQANQDHGWARLRNCWSSHAWTARARGRDAGPRFLSTGGQ